MANNTTLLAACPSFLKAVNRSPYFLLSDRGFDVNLVAPQSLKINDITVLADDPVGTDVSIVLLPLIGQNPRSFFFRGLTQRILKTRPDVVLLETDPASIQSVLVGLTQKLRGRVTVCISCDNVDRDLAWAKQRGLIGILQYFLFNVFLILGMRVVDYVLCINSEIQAIQEKRGFRGRVGKVCLGFDPKIFKPDPKARIDCRRSLGLCESEFVIGYFGRISFEKGVHILIRALARLKSFNWKLLIDGLHEDRSSYGEELRKLLAINGIEERVVSFEANHVEISNFMNCADIAVIPSITVNGKKEQYGRVGPEALACGIPVIACRSGALPEILMSSAVYFEENDVEGLAKGILSLMDRVARERFSQPGLMDANRRLSIQTQAAQIVEAIGRCVH